MDWKIELVAIPVTDVDRAKAVYVDQVGFNADHDHRISDSLRFVQLTPPGSACSIVMGVGITDMTPGSQKGGADGGGGRRRSARAAAQPWRCGERDRRPTVGDVRHLQRSGRQHLGTATVARVAVAALSRPARLTETIAKLERSLGLNS